MKTDKETLKAWRLESHKLALGRWQRPEQVVEWLIGVQSQNYRWGRWSIGLRTDVCDDEGVERAIQNRRIVQTWMFRGTLHFVSAGDLSWLRSLLAPGIIKKNARRYRQLELDDASFAHSQKVMQQVLELEDSLTRAQLKELFEREGVPAAGQQVPYLLQRAALDGLICHGLQSGREPTYALLSSWIGTQQALEQEEALGLLAMRYVSSHGPATQMDFAWWAGLTAKEARLALDSAPSVAPVSVDGNDYWVEGSSPSSARTEAAYLLPPFDEYLLGYKDRSLVLDPIYAKCVNAGGGMPKPTVVINGDVLGTWHYKLTKRKMAVTIQPFRQLESIERDLIEQAAVRLGNFASLPVETSYSL